MIDKNFLIAQLFGLFALFFLSRSFNKNNKKHLLKNQMMSNLSYALQFLFLSAYTGFLLHLCCMTRNYIFSKYRNGRVPFKYLIIMILIMIFLSLISFDNTYCILPLIGIILNSYGLWQKNLTVSRLLEASACILSIF